MIKNVICERKTTQTNPSVAKISLLSGSIQGTMTEVL
jgi:hypothetical protein